MDHTFWLPVTISYINRFPFAIESVIVFIQRNAPLQCVARSRVLAALQPRAPTFGDAVTQSGVQYDAAVECLRIPDTHTTEEL